MAYYLVYTIIVAMSALIAATVVAMTARRLYMDSWHRRLDRERERYSRLSAMIEGAGVITYLGPYRKRPGSAAWMAIEEQLVQTYDTGRARAEAARLFDKLGYTEYNMRLVRSGGKWKQAAGAERLGHMRCRGAVGALIEALQSPNNELRLMAVHALGLIKDPSALPHLLRLMRAAVTAGEEVSRRVLTSALISFGPEAVAGLVAELAFDDWRVRAAALEMLSETGAGEDPRAIVRMIKDPERDVRAKAARCLGKMRDAEAVGPLCEALSDRHWVVRLHAARALGSIGDERAVPDLAARLSDRNWQVRKAVSDALGTIGGPAYLELLKVFTDSPDQYARDQATFELGQRGVGSALFSMLPEWEGHVHLRELPATGERGGIRTEVLIDMLSYLSEMDEAYLEGVLTALLEVEHIFPQRAEVVQKVRKLREFGMHPVGGEEY